MRFHSNHIRIYVTHLLIWIAYILYESSILLIIDGQRLNLWEIFFNFSLYATVFYTNSLYIFPLIVNRRKYRYLVALVLMWGLVILARYGLYLYILPFLENQLLHPFDSPKLFLAQSVWRVGYYSLLSLGYFFAINFIKIEKKRRKLSDLKSQRLILLRDMERELMLAELNNLKSQINPHFLYNSLNFFYSQIYPLSEKTADGILLLSNIMRYALKEGEVNGKVMLEDEVEHLYSYILMNQLRFDNQLQIKFEVKGVVKYRMIIPLILITFVENCFKYGDLHSPEHQVVIRLEISDDQLLFFTFNKKQHGLKPPSSGIGLANIKRRLDLSYGDQYSLELTNDPDFYTSKLIINL